ncbi:MAG: hypothetical protein GY861_00820 [bacterium]|nr:hypothetical protein [bacterium]
MQLDLLFFRPGPNPKHSRTESHTSYLPSTKAEPSEKKESSGTIDNNFIAPRCI